MWRSLSLPAGCSDTPTSQDLPPPAVALLPGGGGSGVPAAAERAQQGEGSGHPGPDSLCPESSAPSLALLPWPEEQEAEEAGLPAAAAEGSLSAAQADDMSAAARAAAELAGTAFAIASRAQSMLSNAQRMARSLASGQAGEAPQAPRPASAGAPPACRLTRQGSRIPGPYLNY